MKKTRINRYLFILVEDEEDSEDENLNDSHIYVIPRGCW